jgi:hypothetical protein
MEPQLLRGSNDLLDRADSRTLGSRRHRKAVYLEGTVESAARGCQVGKSTRLRTLPCCLVNECQFAGTHTQEGRTNNH